MGRLWRCLLTGTLAIVLTMAAETVGLAEERVIQVAPQGAVAAGQELVLRIRVQEVLPPAQATLHYRTIGRADYLALPMAKDTGIEFSAILPGQQLLPPGIEYFFAVTDGRQRVFTAPRLNPRQTPFSIPVSLTEAALGELVFPAMDGARIEKPRPTIAIRLAAIEGASQWASLRLLVDEVDVSPLVAVSGREIRYTPDAPLGYGRHTLTLETMDADGTILPPRSWSFVVPQSALYDKATATVMVDAEAGVRLIDKSDSSEPGWKVQSSATLNSVVESGDFKVALDANGWFTEQEGSEATGDTFNLNNYLLQIIYHGQRLALGDLSVTGTELISESIARRGGLLELNFDRTRAQVFVLRSDHVTGFDDMTGFERSDQRMIGGSLEQQLPGDGQWVAKGTAITGKNASPDGYNTGTLAASTKGQVYSLALAGSLWEETLNLNGEYSYSRFDEDTDDDHGTDPGRAWLMRFSGRAGSVDYGGGYKYLGRDFRSIANATGVDNREEYALYGTKGFQESSLSASLLHNRDNVKKDPQLPVLCNTSLDLAYNVFRANWPNIFFNGNFTFQDSSDEPDATDPIKNLSQTLTGGFSLIREKWSLMPSYTFTRLTDDSPSDADGETHQATLGLGWQPVQWLSLNPSFSYSLTDTGSDAAETETWQGTLAGTFMLGDTQNLYVTFSALDSQADDGSVDSTAYDGVCQYNWRLETSFWTQAQKTLSLRGRYSRTDDRAVDATDEDYSIFLLLSVGGLSLTLL